MDKFKHFEEWLRATHQLNWRENIAMMNSIDKILMVPNLQNVSSHTILNQLLSALRSNVTFGAKPKTERDKEIKVFKLFIQYREEQKVKVASAEVFPTEATAE